MAKKKQTRREKRLLRHQEKLKKDERKSVRLAENVTIPDRPIRGVRPILGKPLWSKSADNYRHQRLSWDIVESDCEGIWSWNEPRQWTDDEYSKLLKPHFVNNQNNTWEQIEGQTYNGKDKVRRRSNKNQPLETLCNEAQVRWLENDKLYMYDTLFRFRLGTNRRVWGVRISFHFFVVWYERRHKIYPID